MDALEYLKTEKRFCKAHFNDGCESCPLYMYCKTFTKSPCPEEQYSTVMEWAKEHPPRLVCEELEDILSMYQRVKTTFRGGNYVIIIPPDVWEAEYEKEESNG